MRLAILFSIAAALTGSVSAQAAGTPADFVRRMPLAQARTAWEKGDAVFVDVRGDVPWSLGHLPGALSIPLGLVKERQSSVPKDKLLIFYCACSHEGLSADGAVAMQALGFSHTAALVGGVGEWQAAGLPLETTPQVEEAPVAGSSARIMPPEAITCPKSALTSSRILFSSLRERGSTIRLSGRDENGEKRSFRLSGNTSRFLIRGRSFTRFDWEEIATSSHRLLKPTVALVWECRGGETAPLIDWRPGESIEQGMRE